MVKNKLAQLVENAAHQAQEQGLLPPVALPEAAIERPQNLAHGDYASSLPLKMARAAGMKPIAIADAIVQFLPVSDEISRVETAPPGFINFTLRPDWLASQVETILAAGASYGDVKLGNGSSVQVEFVSANPTGPLHVGHGRGAVLGSTLANTLSAAGYAVTKEYYLNDTGNQVDAFSKSLFARYAQALGKEVELPEGGYHGQYLIDLAKDIAANEGSRFLDLPEEEALEELEKIGLERMIGEIKEDLTSLGVDFDVWFSEKSLYQNGLFQKALDVLREGGYIAEKEGATWFTSTTLGDDKDNVIIRSSGVPTYFASDIAYHYDKFVIRNFQRVINIWGADHQGHVSRMMTVAGALGINQEKLQIIISQLVTLRRGDEIVRISKRSGDMISLREVINEVGPDACRFFFLARSADAQMDFDLELAKQHSAENPVYYVQYAHARIASILHLAAERGLEYADGDVSLLTSEPELALIRKMLQLPEFVETAAKNLAPHHLPHYAMELATTFHDFYEKCRVVGDDEALTKARLKLVEAAKATLARTLGLMGMTAPDQM
jgi:arginyl-tRNA synthetase